MKQDKLISHYQKIHENQEGDFRNNNLNNLVLGELRRSGRILDLGCGTGHLTVKMLAAGYEVAAMDNSDEMIEFVRRNTAKCGYKIQIEKIDAEGIKKKFAPGSFDGVTLIDVLEHVERDEQLLTDIFNLLKPKGELVIVVPAYRKLYGLKDKEFGHYRRYDRKELVEKLVRAGFNLKKIRYWNFIGLLPYLFYEKFLKRPLNQELRYKKEKGFLGRAVTALLNGWFALVENNFNPGTGLALLAVAARTGK